MQALEGASRYEVDRGGLFSKPAALRAELERAFPERPFAVRFWDGSEVEATAPGPTFLVNSPAAIAHLLRAPGELGLARAYVQGLLDVDDIDGAIAAAATASAATARRSATTTTPATISSPSSSTRR